MPPDTAPARTLDRIAARLTETLPDGCHAGAVYPVSRIGPNWNLFTLHVYGHGDCTATIMFHHEPTPELLQAIGKAFCDD